MKIAHLLGWYFPDSVGGTEVYVEGLCRRLRTAGHHVSVLAPDAHQTAAERYEHDGVPVFRYPIAKTPTRDEAHHRVPVRGAEQLHRWLADQRPDVLHIHSITTGIGLPEIREARRLGVRIVLTSHLPGFGYMCRSGELMQWGRVPCDGLVQPSTCASCNLTRLGLPKPLAVVAGAMPVAASEKLRLIPGQLGTTLGMSASIREYQRMQRELFDLVDWFVVLNETGRRMLLANGSPGRKIVLNRLGLSHTQVASKPGPDAAPTRRPVRFGYAGRLHPTKGLLELARAVRAIPSQVDFRLDIRGPLLDADSRAFAAAFQGVLEGDSRVSVGPGVPVHAVPALLAGFDVLVCPSTWFENGPTIAIEAIAVGTPVIASRVGNLAELITHDVDGALVTPGSIEDWAEALTRVATGPATTIDKWRAALPSARTMDEIAADYLALYAA